MSWIRPSAGGIVLSVRVVPRASRNEVMGALNDELKIRLQAPPVEGKANAALVEFLAEALDVPRRAIALVSGTGSRSKRVEISGISVESAWKALGGA